MATAIPAAKTRSPNYPAIGLEEAVQKLKQIYDKQRRYPATRETFAKLMGYGSLNGASATIVSALGKYGLLDGHGDNLRVSEMGQDIVLHRKGDPEYTQALQTAAFMPAFFRELREQYPDGLPSEHSLRATLIKRGFNPKAIDGAVRAYRDTIEFLNGETDAPFTESDQLSRPEAPTPIPTPSTTGQVATGFPGFLAGIPPAGWEHLVLGFKLAEDTQVRSEFTGRVTQEAIRKFIQLLEVSLDTFPTREAASAQVADDDGEQVA